MVLSGDQVTITLGSQSGNAKAGKANGTMEWRPSRARPTPPATRCRPAPPKSPGKATASSDGARRLNTLANWGLAALGVLVLGLACTGLVRAAPEPLQQRAGGALRIAGSSGQRAILSATDLAPGATSAAPSRSATAARRRRR